jgi:hypothetical protein
MAQKWHKMVERLTDAWPELPAEVLAGIVVDVTARLDQHEGAAE